MTSGSAVGGVLLAMGETMAVLVPCGGSVADADDFLVDAGGAESNVLAHAAALGVPVRWHSRLGADALGERVLRQLAARRIDVSRVVRDPGHPTGVYVKDPGRGVSYYRAGSAAAYLDTADADAAPFDDVALLHLSGITAALSEPADRFLRRAALRARELGIPVSLDVNYRAALWSVDRAAPVLAELVRLADVVFVGRDEAETLWGTRTAEDVRALFPDVAELVVKDGHIGATVFSADVDADADADADAGADAAGWVFEPSHEVEVLDAVGAGDAFAGGYLAALLQGADPGARLRRGHDRAALTLAVAGDSLDERTARR
ncbi:MULTISPECIES: sugar kinase [unclassified Rathayibacter]|uniref:sugar kinase n=1 Tax=unclassified Rathayibacter TaxID=2609250 RepID=UPI0010D9EB57|nr:MULTISPECIES: sugar kinase [unclassified Rathayibacter]TCL86089.1 2-dehydro-3-deoxygluconokinase [Rathayibacter sp. PhB192]TCM31910.1 2-dehydro-3-deoxygluconokinase [Rathayibacter sp. PhB179]